MKESFETNLANSQKEEMQSQKDYEDLKAAKEAEIAAGQDLIDTKTMELGTTDEKNAQSKESLEAPVKPLLISRNAARTWTRNTRSAPRHVNWRSKLFPRHSLSSAATRLMTSSQGPSTSSRSASPFNLTGGHRFLRSWLRRQRNSRIPACLHWQFR